MSIYIKGMEMPKNDSMIVAIRPDGMVEDVIGCYVGKAIFVPPHGRLGDLDELAKQTVQAFKEAPSFTIYKMSVNDRRMNNSRVQKNMKTKAGLAPCEGLNEFFKQNRLYISGL